MRSFQHSEQTCHLRTLDARSIRLGGENSTAPGLSSSFLHRSHIGLIAMGHSDWIGLHAPPCR
jgi:hypothetical protein